MAPVLRKEKSGTHFTETWPTGRLDKSGRMLYDQTRGTIEDDALGWGGKDALGRALKRAAEVQGRPLKEVEEEWENLTPGGAIEW